MGRSLRLQANPVAIAVTGSIESPSPSLFPVEYPNVRLEPWPSGSRQLGKGTKPMDEITPGTTYKSGILDRLKSETLSEHMAIESTLDFVGSRLTPEGYRLILMKF